MKLIAWSTDWWDDAEAAARRRVGLFGAHAWFDRATRLFSASRFMVGCGTWSDPACSPYPPQVEVVNSGIEPGVPYDVFYRQYWSAAAGAVLARALDRKDWDLLVFLETDALIGAIDIPKLFVEFLERPALILAAAWCGCPSSPLFVLKREGASRFQHYRCRANLYDRRAPTPILSETELAMIFKGRWWNPWPEIETVRQDAGVGPDGKNPRRALNWPMVRQPHPGIVDEYIRTQSSKAIPMGERAK